MSTRVAGEKWGLPRRSVTLFVGQGRIPGVLRHEKSGTLLIPKEAEKPVVYRPFQQHEPLPKHKMESLVDYVSAGEIAVVWGVSEKRVQNLIKEGRVPSVVRINGCKVVFIPKGTPKPQVRSYAQKRTTSQ